MSAEGAYPGKRLSKARFRSALRSSSTWLPSMAASTKQKAMIGKTRAAIGAIHMCFRIVSTTSFTHLS